MRHPGRTPRHVPADLLRLVAACLVVCSVPCPVHAAAPPDPDAPARTGPTLGMTLSRLELEHLSAPPETESERPFVVRLVARWSEVETSSGDYDWTEIERAVSRVTAHGHTPVLCLTGTNPLYDDAGGTALEPWTAFVREAWTRFAGRVRFYQIWESPDRGASDGAGSPLDPRRYAFAVKSSALALRAEARADGLDVRIVQGDVAGSSLDWQRAVWGADVAPYIDVLPVRLDAARGEQPASVLGSFTAETLLHPPAPEIWAFIEPGVEALDAAVESLAGSASVAVIGAGEGERPRDDLRWAVGLSDVLSRGFAPAPTGPLALRSETGQALSGARIVGRFLSDEEFVDLVVVDLSASGLREGETARLVVPSGDARDLRFVDPLTGKETRTASTRVDDGTSIRVPYRPYPVAVSFRRPTAAPGFELPPEELEVARRRGLTAEEIIAQYQAVQKEQDDRLERLMSRGRVQFHYRLSQAGAGVDVAIESNYFWERGGELEWEQTDYYLNGNRARWKKFPKLPLIQPEKVMTVPLDLTLDKTYVYRLEGEGRVDDRPAYILGFEPADTDTDRSLFRGRVWIDRETFVRLRASFVQTRLEPPVLSNEETDLYRPFTGPDGRTYWLLAEVRGQQLWTVAGRSFVVQRELDFSSFQINPDRDLFERQRTQAYASTNQMLRDTSQGFRYLERQDDGSRVVKEKVDPSQLFVAVGAFKDNSIDTVLPVAGVNYFNYDLWGKNLQTNVFFAGAFAFANLTAPDLFEGKMDGALEATLMALYGSDKVYVGDDEVVAERIDRRGQNFSGRIGFPIGDFFKINLVGAVAVVSYEQDKDGKKARNALGLDYALPPNHEVLSGRLEMTYDRRGYSLNAAGSVSTRTDWAPWGLQDPSTGEILNPDYDPAQDTYTRWGLGVAKEWFLPKFQKVRANVSYMDGRELDRFSQYQFSFFGGTRLSGFAGSGVRFDRGAIARAGYSFNLFDVIQFSATVEQARVERRASPDGSQRFTGVGISGNTVGPWKTVIALSYGRAVQADIADVEGQQEFLLTVFKLF